ncbi:MAG TPA: hypothetical protein VJO72_11760, partial [Candidatus Dormibacteraeota bacterium]|nr:hypothetical protein [Candidatus Dormibacteraeota bacterium]
VPVTQRHTGDRHHSRPTFDPAPSDMLELTRDMRQKSEPREARLALVFHEAWLLSGAPKRKNAPELG